jgi:hypothetical protein
VARIQELLHHWGVDLTAFALAVWSMLTWLQGAFLWGNPTPSERFFDVGFSTLYKTRAVCVFDPQNESSAMSLGEQPVVKSGAHAPHMEWAGGAWSESDANGSIGGGSGHSGNR